MNQGLARLQWPQNIVAGDVVKVRLLVQHPMHTGYQQDMQGSVIARNVVLWLTCTLGDQQVFRVEPSSGIAANPYFEFFVRARASADMVVRWQDDLGLAGQWQQRMVVADSKTPGP
jgi:sulfur-oxidizing protein SoxZ